LRQQRPMDEKVLGGRRRARDTVLLSRTTTEGLNFGKKMVHIPQGRVEKKNKRWVGEDSFGRLYWK